MPFVLLGSWYVFISLGYFVGAMCRKTLVFRRILFKCKVSSVIPVLLANSADFFGDLNGF